MPHTWHEEETWPCRIGQIDRVAGVDRWKRLLESPANSGDRRLGSVFRNATPETPDHIQSVRFARTEGASFVVPAEDSVHAQRQPDFRPRDARAQESVSRHADDGELFAVDTHEPPEGVRAGAELLPELIADDRDADAGAGTLLFRGERSSMRRRRTEHLEVVVSHRGGKRTPRAVAGIETDEVHGVRGQARKDVGRSFLDIAVVRVGEVARFQVRRRRVDVQLHHFVRIGVQRPQQQAIDEAEHADVDADAERQRHHRRDREPGAATQRPQREAHVLDEVLEPPPPPGIARFIAQAQCVPERLRITELRAVRFHLSAQFLVHGAAAEQVVEATDPLTDEGHQTLMPRPAASRSRSSSGDIPRFRRRAAFARWR